ncbi:hypothetical protein THAOC_28685 [Thalassiosira oceanica]|uniref:Uncharacterized protein n=1 Tax=Thalassiosira oceanica TaxID=159749 RepID=K0REE2_THAOC|nr:hypothetical protein THAOC_28685 [Thalassiosira oceanica]|eukprot:EJK52083.1 hypothetical protein THAOC_28685 [Thalassiosira oceanica]
MKCCDRRAIPMALRPPLSIKQAGASANLCIIKRARPAEKAVATTDEVRCGIELSPCSAACPSETIYTSFRPDICVGLLGGTSVGWPPVRLRICRSDDAAAGMTSSISLLSMLPTDVRWRLVVEVGVVLWQHRHPGVIQALAENAAERFFQVFSTRPRRQTGDA